MKEDNDAIVYTGDNAHDKFLPTENGLIMGRFQNVEQVRRAILNVMTNADTKDAVRGGRLTIVPWFMIGADDGSNEVNLPKTTEQFSNTIYYGRVFGSYGLDVDGASAVPNFTASVDGTEIIDADIRDFDVASGLGFMFIEFNRIFFDTITIDHKAGDPISQLNFEGYKISW